MSSYEMRARVGEDGKLEVVLPSELAGSEVRLVIERVSARVRRSKEQWREFVRSVAGSIPDFPDVVRPGPDSFEHRESID
ncbi:hypothetical protein PHYC_02326 [Phycisphaerales bacterium]|nr:hypothetical protein PHYC_02326 [Phycisphaerales bacterium]